MDDRRGRMGWWIWMRWFDEGSLTTNQDTKRKKPFVGPRMERCVFRWVLSCRRSVASSVTPIHHGSWKPTDFRGNCVRCPLSLWRSCVVSWAVKLVVSIFGCLAFLLVRSFHLAQFISSWLILGFRLQLWFVQLFPCDWSPRSFMTDFLTVQIAINFSVSDWSIIKSFMAGFLTVQIAIVHISGSVIDHQGLFASSSWDMITASRFPYPGVPSVWIPIVAEGKWRSWP